MCVGTTIFANLLALVFDLTLTLTFRKLSISLWSACNFLSQYENIPAPMQQRANQEILEHKKKRAVRHTKYSALTGRFIRSV
jgi:hypothetical protein